LSIFYERSEIKYPIGVLKRYASTFLPRAQTIW